MARVIMRAVVSVDGFIADPDGEVGPLSKMDVAPVVMGEGVRFFGGHTGTVLLDGPDRVVQGDRVLHMHYTVRH